MSTLLLSVSMYYSVQQIGIGQLHFVVIILGYQFGNVFCDFMNFKQFVFPNVDCRWVVFCTFDFLFEKYYSVYTIFFAV